MFLSSAFPPVFTVFDSNGRKGDNNNHSIEVHISFPQIIIMIGIKRVCFLNRYRLGNETKVSTKEETSAIFHDVTAI